MLSRLLFVILAAAALLLPAWAGPLNPNGYAGGRSKDQRQAGARNSSAFATILGEVRTSMSDLMFIKTERYLHSGVAYQVHHDLEALASGKDNVHVTQDEPEEAVAASVDSPAHTFDFEEEFEAECVITSLKLQGLEAARGHNERLKIGYVVATSVGRPAALDVDFLSTLIVVITGTLFAGAALAFSLGARTLVANLLGAQYSRKHCRIGERLKLGDIEGEVVEITQMSIVLDTGNGRAVVPAKLFQELVSLHSSVHAEDAQE